MDNLKKKINFNIWVITFILFIIAVAGSVGYAMGHVKAEVGMEVFDLKFTYNYEYASEFINNASEDIINFYRTVQIPIDYCLAIMLGGFAVVSLLYISKKIKVNNIFLYSALLITILDVTENTLLYVILSGNLSASLVNIAGIVTLVKNICMYATYLALVYYAVKYNIKKGSK